MYEDALLRLLRKTNKVKSRVLAEKLYALALEYDPDPGSCLAYYVEKIEGFGYRVGIHYEAKTGQWFIKAIRGPFDFRESAGSTLEEAAREALRWLGWL